MEEISMCGLFLLEVANKVDREFQTPTRSSYHTTRSAEEDISKMVGHLLEEKVSIMCTNRSTCDFEFTEPIEMGMQKIVGGWLRNYLQARTTDDDDDDGSMNTDDYVAELDYELTDTTIL